MDTKQKLRLGLQWGALAWLGYITVRSVLIGSSPVMFAWILACVLLVTGSRWARAVVVLGILVQLAHGALEAVKYLTPGDLGDVPMKAVVRATLGHSGLALCLGMLPLVAWRLERPRLVLALLALGRFRDAWARAGGGIALLAAVPVVALNHAMMSFFRESRAGLVGLAALGLVLLVARYGEVIVAWPVKGRHPR